MAWGKLTSNGILKAPVLIPGLLVVILFIYIFGLPFYPDLKYRFFMGKQSESLIQAADTEKNNELVLAATSSLPVAAQRQGNYLIIEKIGVDIQIIEAANDKQNWALNRGAWRLPQTSTPQKGSNMALAGHRFKYLPPNNLTFYLLDKLAVGDKMIVFWEDKEYQYRVIQSKIVPPSEISVLAPTTKTIITLITCDPIWSQKNRLVVVAELIE